MKTQLLILVIFLGSCAPDLTEQVARFDQQEPNVASWNELNYEQLLLDEEKKVSINDTTPVWLFTSGKSHVKSFSLPDKRPLLVTINSYFVGDVLENSYVFIPCVALLDSARKFVSSINPELPLIERASVTETAGMYFKTTVSFVVTENDSVDFFVIYTTDKLLNATSSIDQLNVVPIILPGVVTTIPIGKRVVKVPHGPVGQLKIMVTD